MSNRTRLYFKIRVCMVFAMFVLCFGFIVMRAYRMQVLERGKSLTLAQQQYYSRRINVAPHRGTIYDSKGRELAVSMRVNSLYAQPAKIQDKATVASQDEYVTVSPPTAYLDTIGKYEQVLTVVNRDEATYKVSVASPPPDFMEIDPATSEVGPEGETKLVLKAGDDTPIGIYTGSLTLRFQGPRSFSVTVPIYGMGFQR